MKSKKALLIIFSFISLTHVMAQQETSNIDMADGLYASGKIYVVVTVLAVILTGIFLYLFLLDRKLRKMEKKINKDS